MLNSLPSDCIIFVSPFETRDSLPSFPNGCHHLLDLCDSLRQHGAGQEVNHLHQSVPKLLGNKAELVKHSLLFVSSFSFFFVFFWSSLPCQTQLRQHWNNLIELNNLEFLIVILRVESNALLHSQKIKVRW